MTATEPNEHLPTRRSLLSKLKSWENQDSWRDFFDTYWRLIYNVSRKARLEEAEAQEAVQERIISVAKEMKDFRYDPAKGSFKGWLLTLTRRRIAGQMRKRYRSRMANRVNPNETSVDEEISLAHEEQLAPEAVWDREWRTHLLSTAMTRGDFVAKWKLVLRVRLIRGAA